MRDFELIQELKKRVSALEEENKLLREFVVSVEFNNKHSHKHNVVQWTKKEEKFKNIDWSC